MDTKLLVLALLLSAGCGNSVTGPSDVPGGDGAASAPSSHPRWQDLPRPNILMIVADDMGWGDLGSFGSQIKTPVLDQLATDGMRLTSFYTNTSLCAPSRASILTGRWARRTGIPWNPPVQLHADEVVIAQVLRTAGYATAMFGKWHLGWVPETMPTHYGFDRYAGIPGGCSCDMKTWTEQDQYSYVGFGPDQITEQYTDEALEWLHSLPSDQRWFLAMMHRDPHTPLVPPRGFYKHSSIGLYGDMVEGLDYHIGRLLDEIKAMGQEENTIVVFLSDNGPARESPLTIGSAGPFRGQKGSDEEGGVRVPAIVRWPAAITEGHVNDQIMSTVDLFPSFVALARAQMPARHYDGASLLDAWTGAATLPPGRAVAFFQTGGREGGIRVGPYKLLLDGTWGHGGLYDLDSDQGERHDLSTEAPDVVARLRATLESISR